MKSQESLKNIILRAKECKLPNFKKETFIGITKILITYRLSRFFPFFVLSNWIVRRLNWFWSENLNFNFDMIFDNPEASKLTKLMSWGLWNRISHFLQNFHRSFYMDNSTWYMIIKNRMHLANGQTKTVSS